MDHCERPDWHEWKVHLSWTANYCKKPGWAALYRGCRSLKTGILPNEAGRIVNVTKRKICRPRTGIIFICFSFFNWKAGQAIFSIDVDVQIICEKLWVRRQIPHKDSSRAVGHSAGNFELDLDSYGFNNDINNEKLDYLLQYVVRLADWWGSVWIFGVHRMCGFEKQKLETTLIIPRGISCWWSAHALDVICYCNFMRLLKRKSA